MWGITFEHTYPNASIRAITITGDNITGLFCIHSLTSLDIRKNTELTNLRLSNSQLTSLDVSKNTALTSLYVQGQLTSLDVSKNTALTSLSVGDSPLKSLDVSKNTALTILNVQCQLTSSALNALFGTLHSNAGEKTIYIAVNPGVSDCDRSIAERKGWTVNDTRY